MHFAEAQETPDARWHFVECYANWVEQRFSVIFAGDAVTTPQRLLSLLVTQAPNGAYSVTIQRQLPTP